MKTTKDEFTVITNEDGTYTVKIECTLELQDKNELRRYLETRTADDYII